MASFILKRIGQAILVIFIVTVFSFLLQIFMPGDPVYAMLGSDITPQEYDIAYHEMGLDQPVITRYVNWMSDMLQGDFGQSFKYKVPVANLINARLPVTILLGLISIIISTLAGILFGVLSATRHGKPIDTVITLFANLGAVVPLFWLAVIGMYIFAMQLHWLPSFGFSLPTATTWGLSLRQAVLPVFALSVGAISGTTRQMRSSMLEVIGQDYMRKARATGLSEGKVVLRHGLKNALIPVVTMTGMSFRNVVAGAASVEIIFSIAGMGALLVNSVLSKDVAVTQACVVIIAVVVCLANLIVDISYGYLDPRIRIQ